MKIAISQLMQASRVAFGTSGARGLVTDMTDDVCYAYTCAFIGHLEGEHRMHQGMEVAVAGDLRPSTDRIMTAVIKAVTDCGYVPVVCGKVPSPALAFHGFSRKIASIMVTGSHIPEDRNGLKFNTPDGEILKRDEELIRRQVVSVRPLGITPEIVSETVSHVDGAARHLYVRRYLDACPSDLLVGKRIGVYAHSSVSRDIMQQIHEALGATVVRLGDFQTFVPVDTEAIRPEDVKLAAKWAVEHRLDAIVSADGDGDRPMVADEQGRWIRGDILGILTAMRLGAEVVVVPVSCNTAVELCGAFKKVIRTKIGSPYVIEAMNQALANHEGEAPKVVGFEANGGFLTATRLPFGTGVLAPLPTRDALIVQLAVLASMAEQGRPLSKLVSALPQRFTWSGRLKNLPADRSAQHLSRLGRSGLDAMRKEFALGEIAGVDWTDGLRMKLVDETIVHVRPSGNAPELRCYTEAQRPELAQELGERMLKLLAAW